MSRNCVIRKSKKYSSVDGMKLDQALLQKYFTDECTDEQRKQVEEWLQSGDVNEDLLAGINVDAMNADLEAVSKQLATHTTTSKIKIKSVSKRFKWRRYGVAASLITVLLCGSLYFLNRGDFWKPATDKTVQWSIVRNTSKELKRISLSDGSVVSLYPDGVIQVPDAVIGKHRRLKISHGKAIFDIHHDVSSPFTIETGRTTVDVLGTSFVIERNGLTDVVTLQTGRISFKAPGKPLQILTPGQQVRYDSATGKLDLTEGALLPEHKEVKMIFNDTPLKEVFRKLEEKFDLRIEVKNSSIGNLHYTGDLTGKSLEDVKSILTLSAEIRFKENGNTLYVSR